jgi:hypothetical protein
VLNATTAHNVTHADIVRRIKKGHGGLVAIHQPFECAGLTGITTDNAVCAELPQLAELGYWWRAQPILFDCAITKNSCAVAKKCAHAKILIEGTTPAFDKEARMLRSEIDLLTIPRIDHRPCPECYSSMRLAWIEPDEKSGYDKRTFECTHCHHLDAVMVKYR